MLDELKTTGLSENESKVYLALLELGSATVQEIAKKSGVKRVTTYVQLEALAKLGLVTSFEKASPASLKLRRAGKTYFRAEDPENLSKILERERKMSGERERSLSEILPKLEQLYLSSGERPRVRFFDGIEGLRTMQDEFLKSGAEAVNSFSSADDISRIFPQSDEYISKKLKKQISLRLIYTSSRGAFLKDSDSKSMRESRYIPPDKFPVSCDISIYKNTVSVSVLKNKIFGILIENQEIADSMRSFFEMAWEDSEKYNKF